MDRGNRALKLLTELYESPESDYTPERLKEILRYRRHQDVKGALTKLENQGYIEIAGYLKQPTGSNLTTIFITKKGAEIVKRYKPMARRAYTY